MLPYPPIRRGPFSQFKGWHAVKDLNPRRRRFVASRTLQTMLTAYIKLTDKVFSSDRYRYGTET